MDYILIILTVLSLSLQGVLSKSYSKSTLNRGAILFNACSSLASALFFYASGGFRFEYNSMVIFLALIFGVFFGTTTLTNFKALQTGPLALTTLVTSYSLLLATLYGIFWKGEEVGKLTIIGIVFLAISLFLIAMKEKDEKETKKISLKWVIFAVTALLTNGICTILQREQQIAFDGKYKSEFMMVALVGIFIAFMIIAFFKEREDIKPCLKKGTLSMLFKGVLNGSANLFVMILAAKRVPSSLMYPLISGGSIILTWLMSRFFYKENLNRFQNLGLVLGIASVVLLNL